MHLKTIDLLNYSKCPLRWSKLLKKENTIPAPNKLLTELLLKKSLVNGNQWSSEEIREIWNKVFWKDKPFTKDNVQKSVKGIISATRTLRKASQETIQIEPGISLNCLVSDRLLKSTTDFILIKPKVIELWISSPRDQIIYPNLHSIAEGFLLYNRLKKFYERPYKLVFYWSSTARKEPTISKTPRELFSGSEGKITASMVKQIRDNIIYPVPSEECKECGICL